MLIWDSDILSSFPVRAGTGLSKVFERKSFVLSHLVTVEIKVEPWKLGTQSILVSGPKRTAGVKSDASLKNV